MRSSRRGNLDGKFLLACGFLLVFATLSSGCARMHIDRTGLKGPVQMNTFNSSEFQETKSFSESKWNHYFIFRLAPTAKPKMSELVNKHVGPGERVTDLEIKKEESFLNGVCCMFTFGIYCPDTLTVEGKVVKKL